MGWWQQSEDGASFTARSTEGPELIWGDEPADAVSDAFDRVDAAFTRAWGRPPTLEEIQAGTLFSAKTRYAT